MGGTKAELKKKGTSRRGNQRDGRRREQNDRRRERADVEAIGDGEKRDNEEEYTLLAKSEKTHNVEGEEGKRARNSKG